MVTGLTVLTSLISGPSASYGRSRLEAISSRDRDSWLPLLMLDVVLSFVSSPDTLPLRCDSHDADLLTLAVEIEVALP